MGTFNVTIRIGDLGGTRFQEVEAMADTGATTTVIPRTILDGLGIKPSRQETFEYANGQQARLDMAQATAQAEDRETITWVIFGEDGMSPLLGAYTLEGLFLAVDPYNQRLVPVNGLLKSAAPRVAPEPLHSTGMALGNQKRIQSVGSQGEHHMTERTRFPNRPAKTQCPSQACLRAFKVRDVEDDLPEHDAPDGRKCYYVGQGLFLKWL